MKTQNRTAQFQHNTVVRFGHDNVIDSGGGAKGCRWKGGGVRGRAKVFIQLLNE